ncbi:hypothetical protein MMPV_002770 [Pyropia vietnamensis]
MAFKTMVSVAAVAFAMVATAGGAAAVPARAMTRQATAGATSVVGGGSSQVVLVPQGAVPFVKNKRGDEKKVNVKIDVDVKKEEEKKEGAVVVSGLTGVGGQPQIVPVGTPQQPENELQ